MAPNPYKIAVIGCGITGSTLTSELLRLGCSNFATIRVFDQGRSPGGRCSSRLLTLDDPLAADGGKVELTVDHGCQFFRSDLTGPSKDVVGGWLDRGWVKKLDSLNASTSSTSSSSSSSSSTPSFFGFPNLPPFYYPSSGGMVSLVSKQVDSWPSEAVTLSPSSRVNSVAYNLDSDKWQVTATTGPNAIHDTADKDMEAAPPENSEDFDCVVFTDVSSTTFSSWHRASALGSSSCLPPDFLEAVAARLEVSGRVPLFSCIVVFSERLELDDGADAVTFGDGYNSAWFCCRSSAKLGDEPSSSSSTLDAWVVISTPKFGVDEITRVPMQRGDGKFIPQEKSYLREGPCQKLLSDLKKLAGGELPEIVHVDGQRWGSALPGVKFGGREGGKKVCRHVLYDGAMQDLAPTRHHADKGKSFVGDPAGLFQAGDMMAMSTPGVEGAILSAAECAQGVTKFLEGKGALDSQLKYIKEQREAGREYYEPTYLKHQRGEDDKNS
mmetsp:Transcript_6641/g.12819  ORF Transcript_6641/g.12819 Transcript_6641/m.12819 type:complete len:496 (+) Transcript_6641:279-1766(+)|eukprot:CAMPEP_0182470074 /NCGR_PEP_ID=MMETSP1319-20130603/18119_1 /TAXON_ID=172717 /ORGANISM="Bolidomonas pacifica, Strain RCC208" /LENGTH=495 /DNA_ID=CAMNT_0024670475 /DNA_START=201 /DNA_END=1688 /DNA_ORIENTATION=-